MRKAIGCALVLALLAGAAWWASDRAGELAQVDPAPAPDVADVARSTARLAPGRAVAAERDAVEHADTSPLPDAGSSPHASATTHPPPTTATLEGRIVDASGDALSARIELVHPETGASHATGMAFEYRIGDLEPGSWWVRVTSDLRAAVCELVELEPGPNRRDFMLADTTEIDVHLETKDGQPLERALAASGRRPWGPFVFATLEPPGTERIDSHVVDRYGVGWFENGVRSLPRSREDAIVGPPFEGPVRTETEPVAGWFGTLHLSVDPPVFVAVANLPNVLDSVRVEPGTTRVTLRVDVGDLLRETSASLRVRVAAADTGELLQKGWFVQLASWTTYVSGLPAFDGSYRFDGVVPGRYRMSIASPGFVGISRAIELAPGEDRDLGTIALERCEGTTVRVLDPFGRGLAAKVEIALGGASHNRFDQKSDADGRFALAVGHADGLELRVRPGAFEGLGRLASRIVSVEADAAGEIVIRLERCSRIVLRPDGTGCRGRRYSVVDERGGRYARGVFRDAAPVAIELPVGWYDVVVTDRDGVERSHAVQLGERPSVLDVLD